MLREPQHDNRFNVVNLSAKACHPEPVEGSRAEASPTMLREPQHDTRFNVVNLSAKACQPELVEGSRAEALRQATHDKIKNVFFRSRSASGEKTSRTMLGGAAAGA
ncbi:hypothetical protein ABIC74_005459 [Mucilaginibacter rubeus]